MLGLKIDSTNSRLLRRIDLSSPDLQTGDPVSEAFCPTFQLCDSDTVPLPTKKTWSLSSEVTYQAIKGNVFFNPAIMQDNTYQSLPKDYIRKYYENVRGWIGPWVYDYSPIPIN